METHKHQIRTQRLELTFENESRVSQWQQRVIDICQRELQQAIETCLNDYCPHDKLIRFKKLEIDMGSIAMEDLQSEWPAKVKEALRQTLEHALYHTASSGVEIKSLAHTQLDSIAHYLQFGNLLWNHQPSDVSNLIEHALQQEPLALAALMRTLGVSLSVRTRMVERLGHARLCQLVHLLEPHHAKDMIAYHAYLLQLNRKEEMVETQQNVLEKTLWLFVFNYLLVERDSVFNAKSYARSILQQFAFHFNITYRHLVALIVAGLQKWKGALPPLLVGALHEIEQELNEKSESETTLSKAKGEETSAAPSVEKWLHKLPTDSAIDDAMLVQLLDALKKDKHKAIALGQLLARSHEHMPVRMVRHLVPQEAGRIEAYHQYVMSVHNQQPITQVPQRELKNTVWTLIIAYLLDNQGSYFNQKNFLKTLIHRTAAHYNLSEFMLLEKLLKSEGTWKAYPSTIHNFLRIVQEIYVESVGTIQIAKPKRKTKITKSILQQVEEFWKDVDKLNADSSMQFQSWIRHCVQSAPIPFAALLKKYLPKEQVRKQLAGLALNEVGEILSLAVKSPMAEMLQRSVLFLEQCRYDLLPYFGNEVSYQFAIHKAAIDVAFALKGTWSEQDVLRLLFEKLTTHQSGLPIEKLWQLHTANHPNTVAPTGSTHSSLKNYSKGEEKNFTQNVEELIQLIVAGAEPHHWTDWGFSNQEDAIRFIIKHYPARLRQQLAHVSRHQLERFMNTLSDDAMLALLEVDSSNRLKHDQIVWKEWSRNLTGIAPGKQWLDEVRKVFLMADIEGKAMNDQRVLQSLLLLIHRFQIPDLFFERIARWSLPVSGDLTHAIRYIEKNVLQPTGKSTEVFSRKSKLRILRESIDQIRQSQDVKLKSETTQEEEPLFLSNAGLVLVHPYFQFLFEQCHLLNERDFKNPQCQFTAVALMHYAVTGKDHFHEEDTVLYKLLSGLPLNAVTTTVKLKKKEKKLVNEMLHALTTHWPVISNSTPDEVRGNWLMRDGRLVEQEDYWELTIGRKPYDILLNSLPFTLSPVKFAWMPKRLSIHWI